MAVVSSSFAGSENPLSESGMWTSGPGQAVDMQKVSGAARGTALAFPSSAAKLATPTLSNNQFSEIELESPGGGGFPTACTRIQSGVDFNCYMAEVNEGTTIEIIRCDADSLVVLGAVVSITTVGGDKIRLESVENVHYLFKNNVMVAQRIDGTYSNGQSGLRCENTDAVNGILSWVGGDVTGTTRSKIFPKPKLRR